MEEEREDKHQIVLGDSFLSEDKVMILHYHKKPRRLAEEFEGSLHLPPSEEDMTEITLTSKDSNGQNKEDYYAGRAVNNEFCALVFDEETQCWKLERVTHYISQVRPDEEKSN